MNKEPSTSSVDVCQEKFDFKELCMFCGKKWYKKEKKTRNCYKHFISWIRMFSSEKGWGEEWLWNDEWSWQKLQWINSTQSEKGRTNWELMGQVWSVLHSLTAERNGNPKVKCGVCICGWLLTAYDCGKFAVINDMKNSLQYYWECLMPAIARLKTHSASLTPHHMPHHLQMYWLASHLCYLPMRVSC